MIIDPKDLDKHFDTGQPSERKTGTIVDVKKSYGFINIPGEEHNLFFHFSNVATRDTSLIRKGAKVSFQVGKGKGGKPAAINVEILEIPKKQQQVKKKSFHKGTSDDYYLPDDTMKVIAPLLETQNIDNFSLLLNKCALYDGNQTKFILSRKEDQKKKISAYQIQPDFDPVPLSDITTRYKEAINSLGLELVTLDPFTIDWRLIVGLGNESVYETSMTLHHIYGFPYIPGQAVKGVLRSWIILEYFAENENGEFDLKDAEERALKDQGFCDIFGCPKEKSYYRKARRGSIFFFDAFPIHLNNESIQPDIMNPHYGPYYSEGKPPADYHNPVPVTFLTVVNTTFEFFVGFKPLDPKTKEIQHGEFVGQTPLSIIQKALPEALSEHGLGAKTAVGYGYFQV